MTEVRSSGHSGDMGVAASPAVGGNELPARAAAPLMGAAIEFERLYADNVDYIWRALRRLGIGGVGTDDAVQDVFVTAFRRLSTFEGRSAPRTWLYGIALRVARDHRRRARRFHEDAPTMPLAGTEPGPQAETEQAEAVRVLDEILGELDEAKREVFVLAEIEELTVPEIAEALGVKLNTVYSRLRAARKQFEKAVRRRQARQGRAG